MATCPACDADDLEVDEFDVAFAAGLFDDFGKGAFHVLGVAAGEDDAQEGILGVFEQIDLGDRDVVMVVPAVFKGPEDAAFVAEVESIADA